MNKYKVWIRSTPGFYEQYDGAVSVHADNDSAAIEAAFRSLKSGVFPDRSKSMWRVERVERVYI